MHSIAQLHQGVSGPSSSCVWNPRVFAEQSAKERKELFQGMAPGPSPTTRPARGAGTLIPSAQRFVWAAKQPLGSAALGALFA